MRKFEIETKPYREEKIYSRKNVEIKPGVTVLVGCNGAGKTTLLNVIKADLKRKEIPYVVFDNLHEGGGKSRGYAVSNQDFGFVAASLCSSEGENISLNIIQLSKKLPQFMEHGEVNDKFNILKNLMDKIARDEEEGEPEEKEPVKERWILLDAVDSGYSIDNILEFKEYFLKPVLKHTYGNEVYIVISANSFEMANGEQCLDVYNGKYVTFQNYEEYRKFILQTRERKDKRIERLNHESEKAD